MTGICGGGGGGGGFSEWPERLGEGTHRHGGRTDNSLNQPRNPLNPPLKHDPFADDLITALDKHFLDHERERQQRGEWPADDGGDGKTEGGHRHATITACIRRARVEVVGVREHGQVHGERGREESYGYANDSARERGETFRRGLTDTGVPHARAEDHYGEGVPAHALIDVLDDGSVKLGFADGTDDAEADPQAEEGCALAWPSAWQSLLGMAEAYLGQAHQAWNDMRKRPVQENVRPATDGVFRAELPRLETGIVLEIMQRLEEIEHCGKVSGRAGTGCVRTVRQRTFVAVLDVGVHGRGDTHENEQPHGEREPREERSILLSAPFVSIWPSLPDEATGSPSHEILQQSHMPSLPSLDVRPMFPAKLVDLWLLLCGLRRCGSAKPDGLCARTELDGLHGVRGWGARGGRGGCHAMRCHILNAAHIIISSRLCGAHLGTFGYMDGWMTTTRPLTPAILLPLEPRMIPHLALLLLGPEPIHVLLGQLARLLPALLRLPPPLHFPLLFPLPLCHIEKRLLLPPRTVRFSKVIDRVRIVVCSEAARARVELRGLVQMGVGGGSVHPRAL